MMQLCDITEKKFKLFKHVDRCQRKKEPTTPLRMGVAMHS